MDYSLPAWMNPCQPLTGTIISETAASFDPPIDEDDVKAALRVVETYDDALIANLITTAVSVVEAKMSTRLAQRSVTFGFPFLNDTMVLPLHPLTSITSITYMDVNYQRQTLDPSIYNLNPTNGFAQIVRRYNKVFPTNMIAEANAVQVTATVGYADVNAVPQQMKQAVTVIVSDLYLNPDRPMTATQNVDWLLQPFRRGEWLA